MQYFFLWFIVFFFSGEAKNESVEEALNWTPPGCRLLHLEKSISLSLSIDTLVWRMIELRVYACVVRCCGRGLWGGRRSRSREMETTAEVFWWTAAIFFSLRCQIVVRRRLLFFYLLPFLFYLHFGWKCCNGGSRRGATLACGGWWWWHRGQADMPSIHLPTISIFHSHHSSKKEVNFTKLNYR